MSIDYKVIKEALNPETHEKINNQVGEEISKTIAKYEAEIRGTKKIKDVDKFTAALKDAVGKVLAKHLKMQKNSEGIGALTDSITDMVFQQYFGFNADEVKKRHEGLVIDNYDDFSHDYIATTRNRTVQQAYTHGLTGVQEHMTDNAKRKKFFDQSGKDLGRGFNWSDHAKTKSTDYESVASLLSSGIGGKLSSETAKKSKNHVLYSP